MAEFLGDIAFMLEALVFALGLWFIVQGRSLPSKILGFGGWFLAFVGAFGMACTMTYYMKYWMAGEFSNAYPSHHQMMQSDHHSMPSEKCNHE